MKKHIFFLFLLSGTASAEVDPFPNATEEDPRPSSIQADARFSLSPAGQLSGGVGGVSSSVNTELAFGVSAHLGYRLNEHLCLGIAPQYLFNISADTVGVMNSANQIDMLSRVTGYIPLSPQLELLGYVAPGFSVYSNVDLSETGLTLAGGVGAAFLVNDHLQMLAEVGYQRSFFDIAGMDFDTSFVTTTLGLGTRF